MYVHIPIQKYVDVHTYTKKQVPDLTIINVHDRKHNVKRMENICKYTQGFKRKGIAPLTLQTHTYILLHTPEATRSKWGGWYAHTPPSILDE